jgi:hypothetical protein
MTAVVSLAVGLVALGSAPAVAGEQPSYASVSATGSPAAAEGVKAADLSLFRPGNIISNEVFFDSTTMTEGQIDSFLRQQVPRCQAGYTCLKDFTQTTTSRAADSYCGAYAGGASESAARIIYKVAQACGINPQVLIVTLEKEQGLVTHTWPSDWRYGAAMGQGCPDTAGCDVRYNGFYNQMYGAARQFRIYTEGRYFTYYAPGKTWNVRYSPDAACGSSPVYIENQATANLYYYTPYQPNAASLRAGYGSGDSCSTYGNRNFYQRFTDWFGSTQGRIGSIVQASGQPDVYLVSNGTKHHIASYDDLLVLMSRFGKVSTVAPRYTSDLPTGKDVGRYVHDGRTGTLYLLEGDGTKHRFASTDQVATFGYPFADYVDLEPRLIDAFTTGAEVGTFVRAGSAPEVYVLESGTRRHIFDGDAWRWASRGTPGFVATMRIEPAQAIPAGPTLFAPNTLIRGASSGDVLLVTPADPLIHIPSFELAAEFGAKKYTVVPDAAIAGHTIAPALLTPVVTCGVQSYLAANGTLIPVVAPDYGGLPASTLTEAQCGAWSFSTTSLSAPFFIQPKGKNEVYVVEGGTLRHVRTYAQLAALNGSRPLTILTWSAQTAASVGIGAPLLAEGSVVQFTGTPEVYQFAAGELHHVQTYAALVSLGGGRVPTIESLAQVHFAAYRVGAALA